jgi:crotonobetainyl-CoA:carnitine CoA-transferase CaiB-like acyl-CoA transferase
MNKGPLQGIRILDLSAVLMGPFATQILGDMGADVIKVEIPGGDNSRYITKGHHEGMGGNTMNLQRNKRGIVLDLKKPSAKKALLRMVESADVFFYNIRPQAIERLGLSYEAIKAINPRIIYCGAYGYHRDGPYGEKGAYDDLIQGISGIAALNARIYGEPRYVPAVMCDKISGLTVVYSITAALLHRERTGEGQQVDVTMFEAMVAFNMLEHIRDHVFEPPLKKLGYDRLLTPHRRPFNTADGYVCMLPYSDANWRDVFIFAGRAELAEEERFSTIRRRTENIDTLYGILADMVTGHTTAEWIEFCDGHNIPSSPVLDLEDMFEDPHLKQTGFFEPAHHPTEGDYKMIGFPVRFEKSPMGLHRHAPRLGEHSREVLSEAGLSEEEITAMVAEGATFDGNE